MSGGQYVAAVYGAVFVAVLGYVAIIATKLARLQQEVARLLESDRGELYAAPVPDATKGEEEAR